MVKTNYSSILNQTCTSGERDCRTCLQRRDSLLEGLSTSELEVLSKNRYSVHFKAGDIIYKEGSKPLGLLCLNEGKVKIVKRGVSGTEQIVSLKKPVDFIGFKALMADRTFRNTAIALEDTSICIIEKRDFFDIIEQNKQLPFRIFHTLSNELIEIEERMLNLTQKHLRARLADALILLSEVYGVSDDNVLKIAMKRADIASISNMTPSNATRVLSEFAKENIIGIHQRQITIKDLKALYSISVHGR